MTLYYFIFAVKKHASLLSNLNSGILLLYSHAFPKQTWWQLWQIAVP